MIYFLVKLRVEDFNKWKPVFDEHSAMRKAGGSRGGQIYCSKEDKNEISILYKWADQNSAEGFLQSNDLREVMQKAGVLSKPEVYYLDYVEQIDA